MKKSLSKNIPKKQIKSTVLSEKTENVNLNENTDGEIVLSLENLCYKYDGTKKNVINNVNFEFRKGNIYAVTGKSGAGKSTLLSMISGLALPTDGKIIVEGQNISKVDRYDYRSRVVGVVFQGFNLLPQMTATENVILSMDVSGKRYENKKKRAEMLLEKVGIDEDTRNRRILRLSGGEQQRVAIARTLAADPDIILADEPTGNLDMGTQDEIMDIFKTLAHNDEKCVIIVTHSPAVAEASDARLSLSAFK